MQCMHATSERPRTALPREFPHVHDVGPDEAAMVERLLPPAVPYRRDARWQACHASHGAWGLRGLGFCVSL